MGLNQVVAMHGGRHGYFFAAGLHELQKGHLGRGILHGHPVWREVHVGLSTFKRLGSRRLPQVGVEDFLAERQGLVQNAPGGSYFLGVGCVKRTDHFDVEYRHGYGD
jgi:hypothetical protein